LHYYLRNYQEETMKSLSERAKEICQNYGAHTAGVCRSCKLMLEVLRIVRDEALEEASLIVEKYAEGLNDPLNQIAQEIRTLQEKS